MMNPEKLRQLRKRSRLSQPQVSELTGLSKNVISYIENGNRIPTARTLGKILMVYEIQIQRVERQEKVWGI